MLGTPTTRTRRVAAVFAGGGTMPGQDPTTREPIGIETGKKQVLGGRMLAGAGADPGPPSTAARWEGRAAAKKMPRLGSKHHGQICPYAMLSWSCFRAVPGEVETGSSSGLPKDKDLEWSPDSSKR